MTRSKDYRYCFGQQVRELPKAPDGWNLTILPSPGIGIGDVEAVLTNRFSKASVRASADTLEVAVRRVMSRFRQTRGGPRTMAMEV